MESGAGRAAFGVCRIGLKYLGLDALV